MQAAFEEFRQLFPPALCYTKIVPVDEVISVTLFYREDDHLVRLMLDDAQRQQLDQLWDELHFVSRDALTSVDAFAQLMEFATQDADPKAFEPLRKPINDRAAAFRQLLVDCEPKQLDALIDFAARAYRRPLTDDESHGLADVVCQSSQRRTSARRGVSTDARPRARWPRRSCIASKSRCRARSKGRFPIGNSRID